MPPSGQWVLKGRDVPEDVARNPLAKNQRQRRRGEWLSGWRLRGSSLGEINDGDVPVGLMMWADGDV